MKKIIAILMILGLIVALSGCNMGLIGSFSFDKVHVDTHNYSGCFEIDKWYDNETGIEVDIREAGNVFLSEGTYILVGGECPFCKGGEK